MPFSEVFQREVLEAASRAATKYLGAGEEIKTAKKLTLEDHVTWSSQEKHYLVAAEDGDYIVTDVCACGRNGGRCAHWFARHLYLAGITACRDAGVPVSTKTPPVDLYSSTDELADVAVEDDPPVPITRHRRLMTEAPALVWFEIEVEGRLLHLTLRDEDEDRLMQRALRMAKQYPIPAQGTGESTTPTSNTTVSEPGMTRCPYHKVAMNKGKSGWSHKIADKKYCAGHWCDEHDERFWENDGKHGKFWSHKLEGGGYCAEKREKGD